MVTVLFPSPSGVGVILVWGEINEFNCISRTILMKTKLRFQVQI